MSLVDRTFGIGGIWDVEMLIAAIRFAGKIAGESYPPDEDGIYKIVQYEPLGEFLEKWRLIA